MQQSLQLQHLLNYVKQTSILFVVSKGKNFISLGQLEVGNHGLTFSVAVVMNLVWLRLCMMHQTHHLKEE